MTGRPRNHSLTEAQLRRWSPVPLSLQLRAQADLGNASFARWILASCVGSLIAPDGTTRDLKPGEQKYVRGILVTDGQLRELKSQMDRQRLRTRSAWPSRQWQETVKAWHEMEYAHKCVTGKITLLIDPDRQPGGHCPWAGCEEFGNDVFDAGFPRPERGISSSEARVIRVSDRDAETHDPHDGADQGESVSEERGFSASGTGMQRGENGVSPAAPTDEEARANIEGAFPGAFDPDVAVEESRSGPTSVAASVDAVDSDQLVTEEARR